MNRLIAPLFTLTLCLAFNGHAAAATAADITGSWVVDADATWAEESKNPKVAELPAAEQEQVKKKFEETITQSTYEATADTFTVTSPGAKGGPAKVTNEPYKVASIDGDTINIERQTANGVIKSAIEVKGDRLYANNLGDGGKGSPSGLLVLMHPEATAAAATPAATASGSAPTK